MNTDIFEGRWRQMRGELRSWWGKLTDDDLESIAGKQDRLVGVLQEKYGYTRESARQEVERRFREYNERLEGARSSGGGETMNSHASNLGATLGGMAEDAKNKAEEAASAATASGFQSISAMGEKIESLADVIREKAPQEGSLGTAATTVAQKLDAAGSYLQHRDVDHMVGDLSNMVRRYPIPSLLIGLGIGFLIAKSTRR